MKVPLCKSKIALVTGCSSGIGLATARLLRDQVWQVIPTARKPEDLARLTAEGFEPLLLDVTDSASIADLATILLERVDKPLGAIVNNAGYGLASAVENTSRTMFCDLFEVNLFGLQELTNHFIPLFRKQGYGRIVNVSSVLGEISLPLAGVYSASKHALEALSDALHRELFDSGIAVSVIQPGPIKTRFSKNLADRIEHYGKQSPSPFTAFLNQAMDARKTEEAPRTANLFSKPPEAVAQRIVHCLESPYPKRRIRITLPAHFGALMRRFFPTVLTDAVMISKLRKKMTS